LTKWMELAEPVSTMVLVGTTKFRGLCSTW
jgi:hypothetical protein